MIHKNINAEVGYSLYKTGMFFRRESVRHGMEHGMTPEQWQVLMVLSRGKHFTQKQILDITMQDAPTMSRIIKRLKTKGLIAIETSKTDRRSKLIRTTKKGEDLRFHVGEKNKHYFDTVMERFSETKKRQLVILLEELRGCFGEDNKRRKS